MSDIVEMILEIVLDFLEPTLLSLYEECIPKARCSDKQYKHLRSIVRVLAVSMLVVLFVGIGFLTIEGTGSVVGWVLIGVAAVYLLGGFLVKLIAYIRRR